MASVWDLFNTQPASDRSAIFDHSPEGLLVYSRHYKKAAEVLIAQGLSEHRVPVLYLLTHALELALKSFLLLEGVDARALSRRPYGHNVQFCLTEAQVRGLSLDGWLSSDEVDAVKIASDLSVRRELSYLYPVCVELPAVESLRSAVNIVHEMVSTKVADRLLSTIRDLTAQ
jgi:hypothetical protein